MIVAKQVDLVHIRGHLGDELDYRVVIVIELDVLDTAIRCSDDSLIILIVHLSRNDWVFSLDLRDLFIFVRARGQNLRSLVCIPDDAALITRDHDLGVPVDDAADGFT